MNAIAVAAIVIPTEPRTVFGFAEMLMLDGSLMRKYLVWEEASLLRLNWSVKGVSFARAIRENRERFAGLTGGTDVGRSGF